MVVRDGGSKSVFASEARQLSWRRGQMRVLLFLIFLPVSHRLFLPCRSLLLLSSADEVPPENERKGLKAAALYSGPLVPKALVRV